MSRITRRDIGDAATGISVGTILTVIGVLIACGIGALIWWLNVSTSGIKGSGDVHRDQQDAKNREHWSAQFNAEYQQVQADQNNIATLKQAATGTSATLQDRANYLGAEQNCQADVAQYNADASSTLGSPWVPPSLPTALTAATYCEG
jgi:flagellar basal body-associated protein FliL